MRVITVAASRISAELETVLGVRLLTRTTRAVVLTNAARSSSFVEDDANDSLAEQQRLRCFEVFAVESLIEPLI